MMTRPRIFVVMAVALLLTAVSLPAQIMLRYGHGLSEFDAVTSKLAPLNWGVIGACVFLAALSWRASPWIKWASPLATLLVAWNNWLVGSAETDAAPVACLVASIAFALGQGAWLLPQARRVLSDASSRWWLVPRRKKIALPVFIKLPNRETLKTVTYDISSDGAFLAFGIRELNSRRGISLRSVQVGDQVEVNLVLNPLRTVQCQAQVVRIIDSPTGKYPAGIGLRFLSFHSHAEEDIGRLLAA